MGFVESIADFGNPLVLGGNFSVLATEVYFALVGAQYDQGRAAALAVILLALALLAFLAQQRLLGGRAYTSVTGKGDAGIPVALPRPLVRALLVVAVPWLVFTVVIYGMALVGGFVAVWGRDHSFTLRHFAKAFGVEWGPAGLLWTGGAWNSLWNTLRISAVAAPLSAAVGLLTAYLLDRTRFAGQRAFELGTLLSFAVPGTVIGVAYVLAFNVPPIELTGTAAHHRPLPDLPEHAGRRAGRPGQRSRRSTGRWTRPPARWARAAPPRPGACSCPWSSRRWWGRSSTASSAPSPP